MSSLRRFVIGSALFGLMLGGCRSLATRQEEPADIAELQREVDSWRRARQLLARERGEAVPAEESRPAPDAQASEKMTQEMQRLERRLAELQRDADYNREQLIQMWHQQNQVTQALAAQRLVPEGLAANTSGVPAPGTGVQMASFQQPATAPATPPGTAARIADLPHIPQQLYPVQLGDHVPLTPTPR